MGEEDDLEEDGGSPLGALRAASVNGLGKSLDILSQDPVDPRAKWEMYAGAALKPATGGFGESMGNALSALGEGRQQESALRTKYLPLVAQAMLQRQIQASLLAKQMWELNQGFDKAGVGALAGLLTKKEPITGSDVVQSLKSAMDRQQLDQRAALAIYRNLPVNDPAALRVAINKLVIGGLDDKERYSAVTPKAEMTDTGGGRVPLNMNPNAPQGVGSPLGPTTGKGLAPGERFKVEKDPAGNSYIVDLESNTQYFPNSGSAPRAPSGGLPPAQVPGQSPASIPGASPSSPDGFSDPGNPGVRALPIRQPPLAGPGRKTVTGNKFEEKTGTDIADYQTQLSESLDAMRNVQQRMTEMKDLVKQFQPGASGELRLKLSSWLKDLSVTLGLSPEQADSVGRSVSKGDISSAQAFQKLAVQGTLDILKAANPRFTQAEFGVISQNNPNIALDPESIDKMLNFMTKQYQLKSAEMQEFDAFRKGGNDLGGWHAYWNRRAQELGHIKPTTTERSGKESPVFNDTGGRKMKLTDKGFIYE